MKYLFLFVFCIVTTNISSQVTSLDLLMKYNCETNQYDVHIVILEGTANTIPQRAQFNSQISLVVPTGEVVEITDMYMPLNDNQSYTGTAPLKWTLGTPVVAPAAQPDNDFYGITPTLAPASFYNDLEAGDVVKLFSFTAGESDEYDENVRFFNNESDPDVSVLGGDFSNGFTMGGSLQLYNSNSAESCLTQVDKISAIIANVYPNPFQNQFTIELQDEIHNIQIIDTGGKVYYESGNKSKGILTINAYDYPNGVYYIKIIQKKGMVASQRIMKL